MINHKAKDYFKMLRINHDLAFSNIPRNQNQHLTHAYHRYPAKFIPTLASYLIDANSEENDLICDPFGGCGTTLVEALIKKRHSIGIDINPLASLISKTKITPIKPQKLENENIKLLERITKGTKKRSESAIHEKLNYWFDKEILTNLQAIYNAVEETKDPDIHRFYLCAFSNILKNCSKWLMKSIKPTIDKRKIPPHPLTVFLKHLKFMTIKNLEFYNTVHDVENDQVKTKFYLRDARNTHLPSNSIDYILTSPPYVTSYEYADLHQLSLLWFGYGADWVNFKKKFIGTSHRGGTNSPLYSPIGDEIINQLEYNDTSLARNVKAYYEDMADFIIESKRILKKGKRISLVIGNTIIKSVEILNAEVAFEQMQALGYKDLKVEKRQTSSQSITPYRDIKTGQFTSLSNPNNRRAYQYEYIITGKN